MMNSDSVMCMFTIIISLTTPTLIGATFTTPTLIGATFTTTATSLPPSAAYAAASTLGINSVRLLNPTPAAVHAFVYSNTTLLLSLQHHLLPSLAANRSSAAQWIASTVLPFFPRAKITAISLAGADTHTHTHLLLPAARNLRLSLADVGLRRSIAVSATLSATSLVTSFFPPSSAQLRRPEVVVPILRFLKEGNASLMVALQPYHLYRAHPEITLGFALFQEQTFGFRDDQASGERYRNLFQVMTEAVEVAVAEAVGGGVPIVVAETGWPTSAPNDMDANAAYAGLYMRGLLNHLRSEHNHSVAAAYIYEMFDESSSENWSWGFLNPDMSLKYHLHFSGGGVVVVVTRTPALFLFLAFVCFMM